MYLAVDLGTTGCRSAIFDKNLNMLSNSYEEYGLILGEDGVAEQNANLWWELTLKTAKQAIQTARIDSKEIVGISISSQGITLVPVDKTFTPLCNAISWLDTRAKEETEKIREDYGDVSFFSHTGKPVTVAYTLPKIMWLKKHRKEIYEKAYKLLMPMDFLIAKLTGNAVTDHSMASGTLMYDIKNCCWSDKILSHYGIEREKLPEIMWSGEIAGNVIGEPKEILGLSDKCIVAVGAQDQKCAALGAEIHKNAITVSLGTAAAITKIWDTPHTETQQKIPWSTYTQKSTWVTEGVISTAGTCLRWVRDLLFAGESYNLINEEAKKAQESKSKLLFYPHMNGRSVPDFYENATGCFYGIDLSVNRGAFALAVMEGIAFRIRRILEVMDEENDIKELILFGGGAKSPLWTQIIADVTNKTVIVPNSVESACLGAAKLAAKVYMSETVSSDNKKSYIPSELKDYYDNKYFIYRTNEEKIWKQSI